MTENPARALHELLSGSWKATSGQSTVLSTRGGSSWESNWEQHVEAATWVHRIRDQLKAIGQVEAFEGTLVAASRAVFSVDRWMTQQTQGSPTRHIHPADLRALDALALVLDGAQPAPPRLVDRTALAELLTLMHEAREVISESPELDRQTKKYLLQLVTEFEQSLGSLTVDNTLDPLRRFNEFTGAFALAFDLTDTNDAEGESSEKKSLFDRLIEGGNKAFWITFTAAVSAGMNLAQNQLTTGQ